MIYIAKKYLNRKLVPIKLALVIDDEVQYDKNGNIIYLPEKSISISKLKNWRLEQFKQTNKTKFSRQCYLQEDDFN